MSSQERFTLNCNASAARARLNSAIRKTQFAIESGVRGKQLQQLTAARDALAINLDSLNKLQDQILKAANAAGDPWLTSADVCPRIAFPPVQTVEPLLRAEGSQQSQVPLGSLVVVVAVIAVGVAVTTFAVGTDGFKRSLLAIQGIGATADVANLTAQSVIDCLEQAGDNEAAIKVCSDLSDPKRVRDLSDKSSREGGPSLTTALIVIGVGAAAYYIYKAS